MVRQPASSPRRTWRARAIWSVAILLSVLLLLTIFLRWLATTDLARSYVESRVEALSVSGQSIAIDGLNGDLLGRMTVDEIRVSDRAGLWFEAKTVDISWSPMALFGRTLELKQLHIEQTAIDRRPVLVRSGSSQNNDPMFQRYKLDNLRLKVLNLGESVTGREISSTVDASINTNLLSGTLQLSLKPVSDQSDEATASIAWGGREAPILGNISARGREDGLLAAFLGTNGQGPIEIEAVGQGYANVWQAGLKTLIGESVVLELNGERVDDELSASGYIETREFDRVAAFADRLGERVTMEASANSRGEANLLASSDTLILEASAPFDLDTGQLDLSRIQTRLGVLDDAALGVDAVQFISLQIDGQTNLGSQSLSFEGALEAQDSNVAGYAARRTQGPLQLSYNFSDREISIDSVLQTQGFSALSPTIAQYTGADPALSLLAAYRIDDRRLDLEKAEIGARVGTIIGNGALDFRSSKWDLSGTLMASPQNLGVPEMVRLSEVSWGLVREGSQPFRLNLETAVTLLTDQSFAGPDNPFSVTAQTKISPSGRIEIERAALKNEALDASITGEVEGATLGLKLIGVAPRLEVAGIKLSDVSSVMDITGTIANINADGTLGARNFQFGSSALSDTQIEIVASRKDGAISAQLAGTSNYLEHPVTLSAAVKTDLEYWAVSNLSGAFDGLVLSGSATGQSDDPSALLADFEITGKSDYLDWIGSIDADAELKDSKLSLLARLNSVRRGPAFFERISLRASGDLSGVQSQIDTEGYLQLLETRRALSLSAQSELDLLARRAEISPSGRLDRLEFSVDRPIIAGLDTSGLTLDGALNLSAGTIRILADLEPDHQLFETELADIEIGPIARLLARPGLRGTLSGAYDLGFVDDTLSANGALEIIGLSQGAADTPTANLEITARISDETLLLGTSAQDSTQALSLIGTGEVPLRPAASIFDIKPHTVSPIEFQFDGGGPIETLWSIFGPAETRFVGTFATNLSIQGPMTALHPSGHLKIRDSVFEDGVLGFRLKAIHLDAELTPEAILVSDLNAEGAVGGSLRGNGRYAFEGTGDVAITLDKLNALQRSDVSATVSGDLSVERGRDITNIGGDVRIDRARVNINKLPRGGYTTLNVVFPNRGETVPRAQTKNSAINLDIGLKGDRNINVSGTGLDSEWRVDARVSGTARKPVLIGSASIVRGDVDVVGRQFRFSDSDIRFDGNPQDARLNIRAIRSTSDLTASLNVSGTPLEPEFSMTSEPALPDDEVLSKVLFGVSPSQLSPFQAAQLAAAVASLSGSGTAFDLVGPIEDVLNVDRLDFGITEDGNASVGAGKYLAEDVYVELRTNTRGAPGLGVEWTPRRNVEIGAELATEEAPKFTVKWKRDYDNDRLDDPADSASTSEVKRDPTVP